MEMADSIISLVFPEVRLFLANWVEISSSREAIGAGRRADPAETDWTPSVPGAMERAHLSGSAGQG